MGLFQRFSFASALGCGLSYAAGACFGWVFHPATFWVILPFLYYGTVFLLYGPEHLVRLRPYRNSLLGITIGIGVGLFSIGRVNYDNARTFEGMDRKEIRVVEGTLQQDGYRRGGRSVLSLRVHSVEDRRGNRHSARFALTVITHSTEKYFSGDLLRIRGTFLPDKDIFRGEVPVLCDRTLPAFLRSAILGKTFRKEGEPVALLQALCFGIKDGLEGELTEAFRKSGTSHILALSGMHVGILVLLLQVVLSPVVNPFMAKVIIGFILFLYCILVGPFPSLVRAVLMYGIYTIALFWGRRIHPLDLLCHTFVVSCVLLPRSVLSYSNILSFAAVGGILWLTRPLQRYFRRFLFDPLLSAFSVSLGAQIVTAPLTLWFFSRLPLFGWLASILLSPVITLFMWIGILSLVTPSVPFLDPCLQGILEFLYTVILYVAEGFAQAPALQLP